MPKHSHDTTREQDPQTTQSEDDWSKQVLPQLPANLQEQAMKFKAFERSRKISNASDLLRGLLAYVYTAHSFQHLSMWSVLLGIADVSANDWRKRLQKASVWLDWLLQEVLAISSFFSPALVRAGVRRILCDCLRFTGRSAHTGQSDRLPRGRASGDFRSATRRSGGH